MVIECDDSIQPCGVGHSADEDKERSGLDLIPLSSPIILGHNSFQFIVAARRSEFCR